jgi:hypothetical protein
MITGNLTGFQCIGNYYFGNIGTALSGFTQKNPLLTLNSYGYYTISQNSPLMKVVYNGVTPLLQVPNINTDSTLLLDIITNKRVGPNDVGCNQVTINSNTLPINIPLTFSIVGPIYLQ